MTRGMRYESADIANVARFVADDAWSMEQKLDGIRCIVRTDDTGRATFTSHTGDPLRSGERHFPAIARGVAQLKGCTLDGELLATGELWLFDVMEILGTDTRLMPQSERRSMLTTMEPFFAGTVVNVVPEATTATAKAALWQRVLDSGAEGAVVKRRSARYAVGKGRTGDVLKLKVTRTIDAVVIGRNSDGHNNATLGLYLDGTLVPVGKCSMNGKAPAAVGDVIEVTFLNVLAGAAPRLYQPRMMRLRPDKAATECGFDQLDGCTANKEVLSA